MVQHPAGSSHQEMVQRGPTEMGMASNNAQEGCSVYMMLSCSRGAQKGPRQCPPIITPAAASTSVQNRMDPCCRSAYAKFCLAQVARIHCCLGNQYERQRRQVSHDKGAQAHPLPPRSHFPAEGAAVVDGGAPQQPGQDSDQPRRHVPLHADPRGFCGVDNGEPK